MYNVRMLGIETCHSWNCWICKRESPVYTLTLFRVANPKVLAPQEPPKYWNHPNLLFRHHALNQQFLGKCYFILVHCLFFHSTLLPLDMHIQNFCTLVHVNHIAWVYSHLKAAKLGVNSSRFQEREKESLRSIVKGLWCTRNIHLYYMSKCHSKYL